MAHGITTVSFDLWDTVLIDDSDEAKRAELGKLCKADERRRLVYEALGKHESVSLPEVEDAYDATDAEFRVAWYEQHLTWTVRERLEVLLKKLDRRLPEDEFHELVRLHEEMELEVMPNLVPGVADAIEVLHPRYRLAVVSDAIFSPGRVLRQILERYRLLERFDPLVFSDEIGCAKPDPRVFQAVLRATGCSPRELVHVGDREEKDVAGPHQVGARAILFTVAKNRGGPETTAEAICRDCAELPAIIEGLDF
jgi:putative hydrolase of the HAD superfamily